MIQKIIDKEKKVQKNLKKQMDFQMAKIKEKAEKNEEKRQRALHHVALKNKEIDQIGREAFIESINDLESRTKNMEEEEANFER